MKKTILAVVFLATSLVMTSCGDAPKPTNAAETPKTEVAPKATKVEKKEVAVADVYQCPMDCEKGKTYDKAGKCPTCKMDITKVVKEEKTTKEHSHDAHEGHTH